MMMKTVGFALLSALVTFLPEFADADTCDYSCYKQESYTYGCGTWGWSRCGAHRAVLSTCSRYCLHGGWSAWSASSNGSCSASCGGGYRTVTDIRTCTNPAPYNGGNYCSGSNQQTRNEYCHGTSCPKDGSWSAWSLESSGSCSRSCEEGTKSVTYKRTCTNPAPIYGGKACSGRDTKHRLRSCNTQACPPINGGWSSWASVYGCCSRKCGDGVRNVTDTRTCTNPAPSQGGTACDGDSSRVRVEHCNDKPCKSWGKGLWRKFKKWRSNRKHKKGQKDGESSNTTLTTQAS